MNSGSGVNDTKLGAISEAKDQSKRDQPPRAVRHAAPLLAYPQGPVDDCLGDFARPAHPSILTTSERSS